MSTSEYDLYGMKKQHKTLRKFICELLDQHRYNNLELIKRSIEHEVLKYLDTDPLLYSEFVGETITIYRLIEIMEDLIVKKILKNDLISSNISNHKHKQLKHNHLLDYGLDYLIRIISENHRINDGRNLSIQCFDL